MHRNRSTLLLAALVGAVTLGALGTGGALLVGASAGLAPEDTGGAAGDATTAVESGPLTEISSVDGVLQAASTWTLSHQADVVATAATPATAEASAGGGPAATAGGAPAGGAPTGGSPAGSSTTGSSTGTANAAVVTELPRAGAVVDPGGVLYRTDGRPTILMDGTTAAYRTLSAGLADGPDVAQLEAHLVSAGLDPGPVDATWTAQTTTAVVAWQQAVGLAADATVELGSVVFAPGALTVESLQTSIGARLNDGSAVLVVRSAELVVQLEVTPELAPAVVVGTEVSVRLPDGSTSAATVVVLGARGDGSRSATAALATQPDRPITPVAVRVTVERLLVPDALIVPAEAVLHLEGDRDVLRRDDGSLVDITVLARSGGEVAVTGEGLAAGDLVRSA